MAMRLAYLRQAIALGQHGQKIGEGGPYGAVVVKRGKVFAAGWDRVLATNDPTAHAEVVAIRRACERLGSTRLTDCDLYVSAEPCSMCLGAVYWARPRALYYAGGRAARLPQHRPGISFVEVEVEVEDSLTALRESLARGSRHTSA